MTRKELLKEFKIEKHNILGMEYTRLTDRNTGIHYIGYKVENPDFQDIELICNVDIPDNMKPFLRLAEHIFSDSLFLNVSGKIRMSEFGGDRGIRYKGTVQGKTFGFRVRQSSLPKDLLYEAYGIPWLEKYKREYGRMDAKDFLSWVFDNNYLKKLFSPNAKNDKVLYDYIVIELSKLYCEETRAEYDTEVGTTRRVLTKLNMSSMEDNQSFFKSYTDAGIIGVLQIVMWKMLKFNQINMSYTNAEDFYNDVLEMRSLLDILKGYALHDDKSYDMYNTVENLPHKPDKKMETMKSDTTNQLILGVEYNIRKDRFVRDSVINDALRNYLFDIKKSSQGFSLVLDGLGLTQGGLHVELDYQSSKKNDKGYLTSFTYKEAYHYYLVGSDSLDESEQLSEMIRKLLRRNITAEIDMKTVVENHVLDLERRVMDHITVTDLFTKFLLWYNSSTLANIKKYLEFNIYDITKEELENTAMGINYDFIFIPTHRKVYDARLKHFVNKCK